MWLSGRTPDGRHHISVLAVKNLKLAMLMLKMIKCCSKPYDVNNVNSKRVLEYKHHWELEHKKTDNLEVLKVHRITGWEATPQAHEGG